MPVVTKGDKPCKDCAKVRGSCRCLKPHPGPRCHTCARTWKAVQKASGRDRTAVREYGLLPGELQRLRDAQGGFCAILGCRAQGKSRDLVIDHDHLDLEPRGLLCNVHNEMLGRAGDDPAVFLSLALYLIDPPARRVLLIQEGTESLGYYSQFVRSYTESLDRATIHARSVRGGAISL